MPKPRSRTKRPAPVLEAPAMAPQPSARFNLPKDLNLWLALGAAAWSLANLQGSQLGGEGALDLGVYSVSMLIWSVFSGLWLWAWLRGRHSELSMDRTLASIVALLALLHAVPDSATSHKLDTVVLAAYVLGALAGLYAASGPALNRPWQPASERAPETPMPRGLGLLSLGLLSLGLGWLTWQSRGFAATHLRTNLASDALFLYFMGRGGSYEGVAGGPPPQMAQYVAMGIFFLGCMGALLWLAAINRAKTGTLVAALFFAGILGKLNLAWISPTGFAHLGQKIANIGTAYYALAPRVEAYGLWNFVLDFNKLQGTLSTHAETHPFGPELLYVFLIKLVGRDPLRVAYAIMALAALAFVPVFLIAKRLFGSRWAGLAAGLLYLFSPVQLLLSGGGIDCLVTMMLAWILYFLQRSLEEDGPGLKKRINWAGRAGRFLFLTMLLTPGVMLPLLFCGLWVGWLALKRATGLKDWFTRIGITGGIFLASTLLMHLLLWAATGGRFVYLRVTNSGLGIQKSMPSVRPYATWVWLDAFLICAFCGLPLLAILLIRAARAAKNLDGRDGLLVSGLLFLGLVVFMSLGAAEAQRMFQYSILIFVLCSVPFVLGPRAAEEDAPVTEALNLPLLFLASALLFANTVVLASTILDFW